MADAGESNDCILLTKIIKEGKFLEIYSDDSYLDIIIKNKMNHLVSIDEIKYFTWNNKKYPSHSAWSKMDKVLIKINQLRQKNLYYKPLKI